MSQLQALARWQLTDAEDEALMHVRGDGHTPHFRRLVVGTMKRLDHGRCEGRVIRQQNLKARRIRCAVRLHNEVHPHFTHRATPAEAFRVPEHQCAGQRPRAAPWFEWIRVVHTRRVRQLATLPGLTEERLEEVARVLGGSIDGPRMVLLTIEQEDGRLLLPLGLLSAAQQDQPRAVSRYEGRCFKSDGRITRHGRSRYDKMGDVKPGIDGLRIEGGSKAELLPTVGDGRCLCPHEDALCRVGLEQDVHGAPCKARDGGVRGRVLHHRGRWPDEAFEQNEEDSRASHQS